MAERGPGAGPIKVLIVDDSAVMRQALTSRLHASAGIEVIAAVPDPIFAMRRMNQSWPDVVLLDLEMPRMDGLTFLKKIMAIRPTPVVICSALTERGARTAMTALAAGAVAVIAKPATGLRGFVEDSSDDIVTAVRAAAAGRVRRPDTATRPAVPPPVPHRPGTPPGAAGPVVAIGASTGGTQALETVLTALPRVDFGIVVVQHMPAVFTNAFAARLDPMCQVTVKEAADGDPVRAGHVLVAPGGRHMELRNSDGRYRVRISDGPPVNRHRPSVDVLFRSVAEAAGPGALGIIMTGMGDDGARGLLEMRRRGALSIAQDEATCAVYGMPGSAVALGAVDREVPLPSIAEVIRQHG
ncbi:chemotaxis response regulator protein-glutamate methylesterase [Planomonospora alba]|uniref:Protein-glutamate methylesterase/protein-glutamine glutaminase n=1 Tax=Planomonospora alba TaxID=161354 RepID=A0ABP6NJC1_9ACTN